MLKITKSDKELSKFDYLKLARKNITNRWATLNWLCPCERLVLNIIPDRKVQTYTLSGSIPEMEEILEMHVVTTGSEELGTKVEATSDRSVYGVVPSDKPTELKLILLQNDANQPPFRFADRFELRTGDIANYIGEPVVTDVGKYIINTLLLEDPFGDLLPYMNERIDPGVLDKKVAKLILDKKIGRKEYNTYMNNGYWYGNDASVTTVAMTEKALITDPKLYEKRKELYTKYKDQLDDPNITTKIEKELVAIDKAWLKNDESWAFFAPDEKKTFNDQRKKMYAAIGTAREFKKDSNETNFSPESLEEGYNYKNFTSACNEIRRGSYNRGVETAKGGAESKWVLRIFNSTKITEDDCHSTKGIEVTLNDSNFKDYDQRWTVDGILIDSKSKDKLLGKTVKIRSPLYCKTVGGLCYKCCGELMKDIGMSVIGPQALALSSKMTSVAMKQMHASGVSSITIKNFSKFLR